jgi:hypothetical protein
MLAIPLNPTPPPLVSSRRPDNAKGLYLKGRAHLALGDHELEGAVEAFTAAARAAPKDAGEGAMLKGDVIISYIERGQGGLHLTKQVVSQ